MVVLNGLKTVRQALVYQAEAFAGRPDFYSFKEVIADGKTLAFNSYSPLWRIQKKIIVNGIKLFSQKVSSLPVYLFLLCNDGQVRGSPTFEPGKFSP